MKKVSVTHELQMYISMLEEEKRKVYTSSKEIKRDLFHEFSVDASVNDIDRGWFEPTIEEEERDLQIMMKNMFS